jgi:hypothetical protein
LLPYPTLLAYFTYSFMDSKDTRARTVRRTLAERRALTPTEQEMQLLTSYVLGQITLEEANELLHQHGRFIIAICEYRVATV